MTFIEPVRNWIDMVWWAIVNNVPVKTTCSVCGRRYWAARSCDHFCSERCHDKFFEDMPF